MKGRVATHEMEFPVNEHIKQFQVKVTLNGELSRSSYTKLFLIGDFKTTPDLVRIFK